jgi:diphthine synthase
MIKERSGLMRWVLVGRGRLVYEPPRFMSPHTAFQQILLTESNRHPTPDTTPKPPDLDETPSTSQSLLHPDSTLAISLSRIGTPNQRIISGTLTELSSLPEEDFGGPLHSVVIVGKRLHPLELEYAGRWCIAAEDGGWWRVGKEVYGVVREGGG